jgi:endoglucanase
MSAGIDRRRALALIGGAALAPAGARGAAREARFARLARGFNLPDQVPATAARRPDRAVLAFLRAAGMTHVRLPLRGESFMSRFSGRATIAAALADFDAALDLLLGLDFAVSADMHPGDDFGRLHGADPDGALAALREAWRNLSSAIRRRPADRVLAELLNEPHTLDATWRAQAQRLIGDLRDDLPATTFVVGPAPFQRVEALAGWRPFDDRNIVYAFHYYDPMAFTHQGLTWDAADPLSRLDGVPFPARREDPGILRLLARLRARGDFDLAGSIDRALDRPWTAQAIADQFAPLAQWSAAHEAPVILNEFGALRFKADRRARLAWLAAVRGAAQASGFGWAHWDYDQGFGLLDEAGRPDLPLIRALLPA